MSEKKAFVMMAYDQEYNRVYSIVIKPALERMGYQCIRQDQAGAGGYIMQNVIHNIAEADVVIADLSAWKFNVAYELGIRHALNRNGTILMCTDAQKGSAQFDVQHLDVMYYDGNWMNNFGEEAIINELTKRIEVIESKGNSLVDSPVHSIYTNLPDNVILMKTSVDSDQADRIAQLEQENAALRERLDKAGIVETAVEDTSIDLEAEIMQAIQDRIYFTDAASAKLKELSQDQDIEAFGKFLAQVMQHGDLDETDCHNVYIYCQRFKAPMLTKIFLEYATKKYPDDEELNIRLAEILTQNPKTRDNALRIANEMIGLSRRNGKYELSAKKVSWNALGAFFNVYLNLKKYEEMIRICEVLLEKYDKKDIRGLIMRNKSNAAIRLDDFETSEKTCRELLEMSPEYDLNYYSCYRLFAYSDRPEKAYEALEDCIRLDPQDEDYYFYIAGHIFDENVARVSDEEAPRRIESSEARNYAVPFIIAALQLPRPNIDRAKQFLRNNNCLDVLTSLTKSGDTSDFNLEMVRYAQHKEITPLFD